MAGPPGLRQRTTRNFPNQNHSRKSIISERTPSDTTQTKKPIPTDCRAPIFSTQVRGGGPNRPASAATRVSSQLTVLVARGVTSSAADLG